MHAKRVGRRPTLFLFTVDPHLPRPSRADLAAASAIAAIFVIGWFLVGGSRDVPVIDDWLYGGSVELLLRTGRLAVPPFSAVYPVAQILWGALFSLPLGFSFVALRASTVCLAAGGCIALYGLARELGCSRVVSLLTALALALDPVFFQLSYSFMTDVPFVSVSVMTLFLAVSAARRGSVNRWRAAAACAVLAFLIRPLAIGLPVAGAVLLFDRSRRGRAWLLPLAASLVAMLIVWIVLPPLFGRLDVADARLHALRWWVLIPPREYGRWNAHLAIEAAFPLAPVVLAALFSRRAALLAAPLAVALAAAFLAALGTLPFPLPDTQTWTMQDFAARTLLPCEIAWRPWAVAAGPWLRGAAVIVLAGALAGIVRAIARRDAGMSVVLAFGAVQLALVNVLWLYNDRYYVAFAPVLALAATAIGRMRPAIAAALLAAWAAVGVSGARDTLAFNDAIATAVRRLEAAGVPPADIDAGYVSNGWRLYMHPERLGPGTDRRYDVPFVTSDATRRYRFANCAEPGYDIVETIPLPASTWQATRQIFLLEGRR